MKRLIRDSLRLSKRRKELSAERFASRRIRLGDRLRELLAQPWKEKHARRLAKRLRRHEGELFTFLDHPEVPSDNNHAERQIRPAVMVRKTSYASGSDDGGRDPVGADERVPEVEATRSQSGLGSPECGPDLPANRSVTAPTEEDHRNRLKAYENC